VALFGCWSGGVCFFETQRHLSSRQAAWAIFSGFCGCKKLRISGVLARRDWMYRFWSKGVLVRQTRNRMRIQRYASLRREQKKNKKQKKKTKKDRHSNSVTRKIGSVNLACIRNYQRTSDRLHMRRFAEKLRIRRH